MKCEGIQKALPQKKNYFHTGSAFMDEKLAFCLFVLKKIIFLLLNSCLVCETTSDKFSAQAILIFRGYKKKWEQERKKSNKKKKKKKFQIIFLSEALFSCIKNRLFLSVQRWDITNAFVKVTQLLFLVYFVEDLCERRKFFYLTLTSIVSRRNRWHVKLKSRISMERLLTQKE